MGTRPNNRCKSAEKEIGIDWYEDIKVYKFPTELSCVEAAVSAPQSIVAKVNIFP